MKFICDDNLGKLARYLRIMGFDTSFKEPISDSDLLAAAASEGRFLLTRDSHILDKKHPFGVMHLTVDDPPAQIAMVIGSLGIQVRPEDFFSRCSRCNDICHPVKKEEVVDRAFPFILKTQELISECPSCRRLYWRGSHYRRLLDELKSAIPRECVIGSWPE